MRSYPVKRPLCAMTLAFIAGLWLGGASALQSGDCAFLCLCALGIALLYRPIRQKALLFVCLVIFVFAALFMVQNTRQGQALVPLHEQAAQVTVLVERAPLGKTYVDGAVTAVDGQPLAQAVPVRVKRAWEDGRDYTAGMQVVFDGAFAAPLPQTNPGGYDEAANLRHRGIFSVFEADEAGVVVDAGPWWRQKIAKLKDHCQEIFASHLSAGEQALIQATLFGDISQLSDDFYNISQQFGIIHIFSVSGLHVTFILGAVLAVARLLRRQHSMGLLLAVVPLLTLYTFLSDATAPAVRASLMGILALLALRFLRYRDPLTMLALAALALLLADPHNLWQIGFQLSFLAMLGLYLLTPRLEPFLRWLPFHLGTPIAFSLAAELVSVPLVAYYFYMTAPLSTLMNLLVVPFFSVLVPLALAALLAASVLPALGGVFFLPVRVCIMAVIALMDGVNESVGTLHLYVGQPSVWLLFFYYLVLLLFCTAPLGKATWQRLAPVLTLLAVVVVQPGVARDLRLTMVDVGQGTGCIYQTTADDWLVFDTGPGSDTVAQTLRYYGVDEIEAVVLSHADDDHIGGMAHVLRDFDVHHVITSPAAQRHANWQTLVPFLSDSEVQTVDDAAIFQLGDALRLDCRLLAPSDDAEAANANQLTCLLEDGGTRVLFTGDADSGDLEAWHTPADLVVVPHHGSKNSWNADFYRDASPKLALISAGRGNRYGHPHAAVTEGLVAQGITTYCTADSGALSVYEKEDGLWFKTFLSS